MKLMKVIVKEIETIIKRRTKHWYMYWKDVMERYTWKDYAIEVPEEVLTISVGGNSQL